MNIFAHFSLCREKWKPGLGSILFSWKGSTKLMPFNEKINRLYVHGETMTDFPKSQLMLLLRAKVRATHEHPQRQSNPPQKKDVFRSWWLIWVEKQISDVKNKGIFFLFFVLCFSILLVFLPSQMQALPISLPPWVFNISIMVGKESVFIIRICFLRQRGFLQISSLVKAHTLFHTHYACNLVPTFYNRKPSIHQYWLLEWGVCPVRPEYHNRLVSIQSQPWKGEKKAFFRELRV